MADDGFEKRVEVVGEVQENKSNAEEENNESNEKMIESISQRNQDANPNDFLTENGVENKRISKLSQSSVMENVPKKTGFLRSFLEKNKVLQSPDILDVSEETNGSKADESKITQDVSDKVTSLCKWQGCSAIITSQSELSHHVHQNHVESVAVQDVFVCLWQGCKVFNKPSCSHSWLSKHMNNHTGDKPFKCMIDSCSMSFSSSDGLSRHVAGHFNEPKPPKRQRGEQKDSPKKPSKRRRMRSVKKRPLSSEMKEDFVNPKTVESIKQKLPHMMPLSCYEIGIDGTKIKLHSKIFGKRTNEKNGETEVLLHWSPDELLPDEWIPIEDYEKHKFRTIHISSLPNEVVADLDPAFYRRMSYRKHHRK